MPLLHKARAFFMLNYLKSENFPELKVYPNPVNNSEIYVEPRLRISGNKWSLNIV
jgi:hypothetical protein